jgi:Ca-activated chloride channel homolog
VKVLRKVESLDRRALTAVVDAVTPRGYTPIGKSLQVAASELPARGPRSIVLVSDGIDSCAPPDPCEVARELARQGVDLRVHAVGFDVDDAARRQLTCLAQATGGTYTDAADAGSLGDALNRVTTRAFRAYDPAGIPITGAEQQDRAPAVKPGAYLDQLDPNGRKYYAVDVPAGYTLYVTATLSQINVAVRGVLTVTRYAGDGTECDRSNATAVSLQPVITTVHTWSGPDGTRPSQKPCDRPGPQGVRVFWDPVASKRQTTASLELLIGLEPPVTGNRGPEPGGQVPLAEPNGQPTLVVGGGSFGAATTMDGSGSYTDTIRPGELVYYRVRLDWGQGMAYRVRAAEGASYQPKNGGNAFTNWYNPVREVMDSDGAIYRGQAFKLPTREPAFSSRTIRYRNREESNGTDGRGQSVAGWYYISFFYKGVGKEALPMSITIDLSVVGDAEPGPRYAGNGSGVFGDTSAAEQTPRTGQDAGAPNARNGAKSTGLWSKVSGAGPLMWAGSSLLVVLLVGALGTSLVVRRRRKRAVVSGPIWPAQPPQYAGPSPRQDPRYGSSRPPGR